MCLVYRALEAASQLGGEDLEPFYELLEGGRYGEFYAEMEQFFYYAQIKRYIHVHRSTVSVSFAQVQLHACRNVACQQLGSKVHLQCYS